MQDIACRSDRRFSRIQPIAGQVERVSHPPAPKINPGGNNGSCATKSSNDHGKAATVARRWGAGHRWFQPGLAAGGVRQQTGRGQQSGVSGDFPLRVRGDVAARSLGWASQCQSRPVRGGSREQPRFARSSGAMGSGQLLRLPQRVRQPRDPRRHRHDRSACGHRLVLPVRHADHLHFARRHSLRGRQSPHTRRRGLHDQAHHRPGVQESPAQPVRFHCFRRGDRRQPGGPDDHASLSGSARPAGQAVDPTARRRRGAR